MACSGESFYIKINNQTNTVRTNLLLIFFLVIALLSGFLISQYPPIILIWVTLALAVFIVSFVKIEWGLYILIFSMLLSPEISIGETAGSSLKRGLTLRFEDFLLVVIGLSWFARNAAARETRGRLAERGLGPEGNVATVRHRRNLAGPVGEERMRMRRGRSQWQKICVEWFASHRDIRGHFSNH